MTTMTSRSKPHDRIPQFICKLCGNWGITGSQIREHGPKRETADGTIAGCRKIRHRAKRCPVCPQEFCDYTAAKLNVAKSFRPQENGELERENQLVQRRKAWSGKRIYEHLITHRVRGEHIR
jgi:hypothetical protein